MTIILLVLSANAVVFSTVALFRGDISWAIFFLVWAVLLHMLNTEWGGRKT